MAHSCKRRGPGFKRIEGWSENAAVMAFRGDRSEWFASSRLADLIELMREKHSGATDQTGSGTHERRPRSFRDPTSTDTMRDHYGHLADERLREGEAVLARLAAPADCHHVSTRDSDSGAPEATQC